MVDDNLQREFLIADLRRQIQAGTYETCERIEGAVDAMLRSWRLNGDENGASSASPLPP
jgi:hypothetical protein